MNASSAHLLARAPDGKRSPATTRCGGGFAVRNPGLLQTRPGTQGRTWLGRVLVAVGLGMIPWLAGLAMMLPDSARAAHWAAAWTGLDSLEALGLAVTGLLLIRRDDRYRLSAMATAALLAADAWFDVMTSAPGAGRAVAIVMAVSAELPVSGLCAVLAFRRFPRRSPAAVQAGEQPSRRSGRMRLAPPPGDRRRRGPAARHGHQRPRAGSRRRVSRQWRARPVPTGQGSPRPPFATLIAVAATYCSPRVRP